MVIAVSKKKPRMPLSRIGMRIVGLFVGSWSVRMRPATVTTIAAAHEKGNRPTVRVVSPIIWLIDGSFIWTSAMFSGFGTVRNHRFLTYEFCCQVRGEPDLRY